MPSPFISVICFPEEGALFFPLEPKKQRSKKIKIKITPDLRLYIGRIIYQHLQVVAAIVREFMSRRRFGSLTLADEP